LGVLHIKNTELVAPHNKTAIIGGLFSKAPPGVEAAPAVIQDSILDNRIVLGKNVYLENVERRH
jgi:hypothetical protein